ncbi:MAG: hypothetical protein H7Z75_04835 [Ferruginibacter sp.]|nr:hypothetical protein [Cytophagales bacterium]
MNNRSRESSSNDGTTTLRTERVPARKHADPFFHQSSFATGKAEFWTSIAHSLKARREGIDEQDEKIRKVSRQLEGLEQQIKIFSDGIKHTCILC